MLVLGFGLGVTASDGELGSPRPAWFLARTLNSYSLPFSKPSATEKYRYHMLNTENRSILIYQQLIKLQLLQ